MGYLEKSKEELIAELQELHQNYDSLKALYDIDIAKRKQIEESNLKLNRTYAFISQINQSFVRIRDKDTLFQETCQIAIEHGKFQMAWIGLVDEETKLVNPITFAGNEDGYLSIINKISVSDQPEGRGPTGTAIREGKHFICNDIANEPRMAPWRDEALKRGFRSSIALPVIFFGKVIGAFSLYAPIVNFFDKEEIVLLDEVTDDISFALESIELERNRQQAELLLNEKNEEIEAQNEEFLQINEELNQTNQELISAKEKAEESDRLKTAFLQNMSHEIRTPMNAIMGFASLLPNNYNNKSKLEKFSEIINQRSNDLLDIINDILDIAKIESGQLPINIEECNLTALFSELSSFFTEYQHRIEKQKIKFSLQSHCGPLVILIDKVKLKQIFINLINNAFKFTNEGKIEGGCIFDENQKLVFYVSDTGIGIPPDKQNIVFERFAQLPQDLKKNIGGTGLGLSIVKGLVSLLGGNIWLESEPCKGSTFSFTVSYITAQPFRQEETAKEKNTSKNILNNTVLIVEDDYYNAEYIKEILADTGLKILRAENGREAVELSINQPVDLVLMDICLPDMDGYEATRIIRKHKPGLKIIAQTAYASNDERQKALNAGCNDYISKPTSKDLLLSMINQHLLFTEDKNKIKA